MTVPRTVDATVPRILPMLNDQNRAFWTGGARGELLIQYCVACDRWVHPPVSRCPDCSGALVPRPVSGFGTVTTWTVNEQPYHPDVPPPYNIVVVTLDEQDDIRLVTNLVAPVSDEPRIGQRVRVVFEAHGETWVPLFEPLLD